MRSGEFWYSMNLWSDYTAAQFQAIQESNTPMGTLCAGEVLADTGFHARLPPGIQMTDPETRERIRLAQSALNELREFDEDCWLNVCFYLLRSNAGLADSEPDRDLVSRGLHFLKSTIGVQTP
ncbi:hypothetical protein [Methylohalobius crimeensis]|uniref:hypothetical protein n=1 Tax=Methylohalobius crimeensis TaxID=244365 RepID=UPI0004796B28|nr:hypothetical protein [Methylohalobius crimeensis]